MTEDIKARSKKMAQVIAKAWADEDFKGRLLGDPRKVLAENGIALPEGIDVKAVENTDKVFYLVIPAKPANDDIPLTEERIAAMCWATVH